MVDSKNSDSGLDELGRAAQEPGDREPPRRGGWTRHVLVPAAPKDVIGIVLMILAFVAGLGVGLNVHPPDTYAFEKGYKAGGEYGARKGVEEGFISGKAAAMLDAASQRKADAKHHETELEGIREKGGEELARRDVEHRTETQDAFRDGEKKGYEAARGEAKGEMKRSLTRVRDEMSHDCEEELGLQVAWAREEGYQRGVNKGGYREGFDSGYESGLRQGRFNAQREADAARQEEYNAAYAAGRQKGAEEGKRDGEKKGRALGREEGLGEGKESGYKEGWNAGYGKGFQEGAETQRRRQGG